MIFLPILFQQGTQGWKLKKSRPLRLCHDGKEKCTHKVQAQVPRVSPKAQLGVGEGGFSLWQPLPSLLPLLSFVFLVLFGSIILWKLSLSISPSMWGPFPLLGGTLLFILTLLRLPQPGPHRICRSRPPSSVGTASTLPDLPDHLSPKCVGHQICSYHLSTTRFAMDLGMEVLSFLFVFSVFACGFGVICTWIVAFQTLWLKYIIYLRQALLSILLGSAFAVWAQAHDVRLNIFIFFLQSASCHFLYSVLV